jgi:hypothetical protein
VYGSTAGPSSAAPFESGRRVAAENEAVDDEIPTAPVADDPYADFLGQTNAALQSHTFEGRALYLLGGQPSHIFPTVDPTTARRRLANTFHTDTDEYPGLLHQRKLHPNGLNPTDVIPWLRRMRQKRLTALTSLGVSIESSQAANHTSGRADRDPHSVNLPGDYGKLRTHVVAARERYLRGEPAETSYPDLRGMSAQAVLNNTVFPDPAYGELLGQLRNHGLVSRDEINRWVHARSVERETILEVESEVREAPEVAVAGGSAADVFTEESQLQDAWDSTRTRTVPLWFTRSHLNLFLADYPDFNGLLWVLWSAENSAAWDYLIGVLDLYNLEHD